MQKTAVAAASIALLLAPVVAFGAGFAKQSLFLSRTNVTEGETVLIHAVVSNDSASKFSGELRFAEGADSIGTVPVSLAAGEAGAVSVSWKPAGGTHKVTAELRVGGQTVESQQATFTIAAKPLPVAPKTSTAASSPASSGQTAAVESSQNIQNGIANYSPQAAGVAAPLFTLIDSGRSALSDVLNTQIISTKAALGPSAGKVLGAEETKNASQDPLSAFWFILKTLYLYVLTLLLFIIGSAAIFYPVFALLFLYVVWRLFRRFRRPAY